MIFDYHDPLVTIVAFSIMVIAGITAIIHGKVKRQQDTANRATERDYAITVLAATRDKSLIPLVPAGLGMVCSGPRERLTTAA